MNINSIKLPSMDSLMRAIDRGRYPRVHPNGFIQLDLNSQARLHVWHPELMTRQETYSPVHDHAFSFTSHCFSGRLVNVRYTVEKDDDGHHKIYEAQRVDGECTKLVAQPSHSRYRLKPGRVDVVQPGENYIMTKGEFHETLTNEPTMTVIQKHESWNPYAPRVMVPWWEEPDNDFHRIRDMDAKHVWGCILDAHPESRG